MARRAAVSFTKNVRERFLVHLAATANVRGAIAAAGISPSAIYQRRLRDPAFAVDWRMALLAGYDRIELALIRRALGLADEDRGTDGEPVGELDVELALKLLTRHKPTVMQATADAVAATFRASRDASAAALLRKLRGHGHREGLMAPVAAERLAARVIEHDASEPA